MGGRASQRQSPSTGKAASRRRAGTATRRLSFAVPNPGLPLQRKAGACACGGGCPRCQAKPADGVTVGPIDDPLEREADRVADQVMAGGGLASASALPASGAAGLQRQAEEEEETELQARRDGGTAAGPGAGFAARLGSLRGGGQPMPRETRGFFESRFGRDFGGVRVHVGGAANRLNHEVGASAFTVGRDIAFRDGAYRPREAEGQHLLAHELAHVVQQGAAPAGAGAGRRLQRKPVAVRGRAAPGRLQRHPVYVSKHGAQKFLKTAATFFRTWGYAPVKTGIDSVEEVVEDLAKKKSLGRITLVTHAHPSNLFMAMLSGGPPKVLESDWRVDLREEAKFDLDDMDILGGSEQKPKTPLKEDPEEIVEFERHWLPENLLNHMLIAARRDKDDRKRLEKIGDKDDVIVRQYLWWQMERAWLDRILDKKRRRAFRKKHKEHFGKTKVLAELQKKSEVYRDILVAQGKTKGGGPVESDFDPIPPIVKKAVKTLKIDPVTDLSAVRKQLRESPSDAVARVWQDRKFLKNLTAVRQKITSKTWFEIQGCRAGKFPNYLKAMQDFFSHGRKTPKVTAPDWYQGFGAVKWDLIGTSEKALEKAFKKRKVRESLKHWYPILMGKALPDPLTWEALRDFIKAPHALPRAYPNSGEPRSQFLVGKNLEGDAFLKWLSKHSYRISKEEKIREALFTDKSTKKNLEGLITDFLIEDKDAASEVAYRPDPRYKKHIISA